MDELLVRRRILADLRERASGDGFVRLTDVNNFLRIGIHHPENFLNVVGHELEAMFTFFKGVFGIQLLRDVAEDDDVTTRNVVRRGCVIGKQRRAIASKELGASTLIFLLQKASPIVGERLGIRVELAKRMSEELFLVCTKNREGCRVGFDADALIVQNQNAVQSVLENGLELPSGGIENSNRFFIITTQEDQESGMKDDCQRKGNQDGHKKVRGEWKVIKP